MDNFSTRLRELREEAGVSMQQLANDIDVSNAAICKWENDATEPKIGALIRLAEYFGCTVDYLVGINDDYKINKSTEPIIKPFKPTKKERELIEIYRGLSQNMKTVLEETLNTWKKL